MNEFSLFNVYEYFCKKKKKVIYSLNVYMCVVLFFADYIYISTNVEFEKNNNVFIILVNKYVIFRCWECVQKELLCFFSFG